MPYRPELEALETRLNPGAWSATRTAAYQLLDTELETLQQIKHPGPNWTRPAPDAATAIGIERQLLLGLTGVPGKPQWDALLTQATNLLTGLPPAGVPSGVRLLANTAWRIAVQVDRLLTTELQDVQNEYVTVQAGGDADLAASDLVDAWAAQTDGMRLDFKIDQLTAAVVAQRYRTGMATEKQLDEADFNAEVSTATYTQSEWLERNFLSLLPPLAG